MRLAIPLPTPGTRRRHRAGAAGALRALLSSTAVLAAVVAAVLAASARLDAQTVHGRATAEDTGLPLQGVEIALTTQEGEVVSRVLSAADGRYLLPIPREGAYKVSADLFGYLRLESPLAALRMDQSPLVDFEMPSDPIELEGVRVSVERREELVRRMRTYGVQPSTLGQRFVPVEAIEKRATATDFGQVLQWQSVAGMRVRRGLDTGPEPTVCVTLPRSRGCAITVLDGVVVPSEVAGSLPVEILGGIAVLTPVEATLSFGTDGGNGAVLVFTKGALIRR